MTAPSTGTAKRNRTLHMVTLASSGRGTIVEWFAHDDAAHLDTNRSELDAAYADIAERLIQRFGGRVIERYVEEGR